MCPLQKSKKWIADNESTSTFDKNMSVSDPRVATFDLVAPSSDMLL